MSIMLVILSLSVLYMARPMCTYNYQVHSMMEYVDAIQVHTIPAWATHCNCGECTTPASTWTNTGLPKVQQSWTKHALNKLSVAQFIMVH